MKGLKEEDSLKLDLTMNKVAMELGEWDEVTVLFVCVESGTTLRLHGSAQRVLWQLYLSLIHQACHFQRQKTRFPLGGASVFCCLTVLMFLREYLLPL